jgi:serine/threonine-protein kinase
VLFLMVTGQKPFSGEDPCEIITHHLTTPPPRARSIRPQLGVELERVIARALEKRPGDRYASADEFMAALDGLPAAGAPAELGGAAAPAPSVHVSAPSRQPAAASRASELAQSLVESVRVRPRRLVIVAVAGVMAVGAVVAVLAVGDGADEPETPAAGQADVAGSSTPAASTASPSRKASKKARRRRGADVRERKAPLPAPPADEDGDTELDTGSGELSATAKRTAALIRAGREEAAIRIARKRLARHPRDVELRVLLGHAYFRKLWFKDAMKEYRRAARARPELARDSTLIARAIHALTRSWSARPAISFLVHQSGAAALPALREAAEQHEEARVRRRARRIIELIQDQGQD